MKNEEWKKTHTEKNNGKNTHGEKLCVETTLNSGKTVPKRVGGKLRTKKHKRETSDSDPGRIIHNWVGGW